MMRSTPCLFSVRIQLFQLDLITHFFFNIMDDELHPILNRDKFTQLERKALFKQSGGITAVRKAFFHKSKQVLSGKIGHIVIDQKAVLGLFSKINFDKISDILRKNQSLEPKNDLTEQ